MRGSIHATNGRLNNAGQIVVNVPYTHVDYPRQSAFWPHLWQDGTWTPLQFSGTGLKSAWAWAINDTGVVAGTTDAPCYWEGGNQVILNPPNARPTAIGASGLIAGDVPVEIEGHSTLRVCTWEEGGFTVLPSFGNDPAPGDNPGTPDKANAINASDQIVGYSTGVSDGGGFSRAALWQNNTIMDVSAESQGVEAIDINDDGVIIGNRNSDIGIWVNGEFYEISTLVPANSGWHFSELVSINNHGEILGLGFHNSVQTSFLLTPLEGPTTITDLSVTVTPAPEAGTVGQNLTYSVTVTNAGPDPATGVTLTFDHPSNSEFVSAIPAHTREGDRISFAIGNLEANAQAHATIVVRPDSLGIGTAVAEVTGTEILGNPAADPDAANNQVSLDTPIGITQAKLRSFGFQKGPALLPRLTVKGGATVTLNLELTSAAAAGGASVALTYSGAKALSRPAASVIVPVGSVTPSVAKRVRTRKVKKTTKVLIRASFGGVKKTVTLTLKH